MTRPERDFEPPAPVPLTPADDASAESISTARPLPDTAADNLRRAIRARRCWAAGGLATALLVLGIAASISPDARGHGTHEQLGLAPCSSYVISGLPCPTCGMTTAFSHTVRFQWWRAFMAQPSGFLMALATLAAVPAALFVLVRGEYPPVVWPTLTPYRLVALLLALFLGGWVFKLLYGLATGTLPTR